jgi:hypothetical protein
MCVLSQIEHRTVIVKPAAMDVKFTKNWLV